MWSHTVKETGINVKGLLSGTLQNSLKIRTDLNSLCFRQGTVKKIVNLERSLLSQFEISKDNVAFNFKNKK